MMGNDNTFSKGQEAVIEKIAYKVGDIVADRIEEKIEISIRLHAAECPTNKTLAELRTSLSAGTKTLLALAWMINMAIAVYAAIVNNSQ